MLIINWYATHVSHICHMRVFSPTTIIHVRYLSSLGKTTASYLFFSYSAFTSVQKDIEGISPVFFYPCQCHLLSWTRIYITTTTTNNKKTTRDSYGTLLFLFFFSYPNYHMGFFFSIYMHSQLFFAPFSRFSPSLFYLPGTFGPIVKNQPSRAFDDKQARERAHVSHIIYVCRPLELSSVSQKKKLAKKWSRWLT